MVSWVIVSMLSWNDGPAGLLDGPHDPPVPEWLVSSDRTLEGDELLKIGDLHEVQNHLQEALPYYQRA